MIGSSWHDERCVPAEKIVGLLQAPDLKIPDNIILESDIDSFGGKIALNCYHLIEIVRILIANAVDAMIESGGTLKIIVKTVHLTVVDFPEITESEGREFVNLAVIVTGCGILYHQGYGAKRRADSSGPSSGDCFKKRWNHKANQRAGYRQQV